MRRPAGVRLRRIRAAIFGLTIFGFTLLGFTAAGAPQPPTTDVGEMLRLPTSVWTAINRFVFLVAYDRGGFGAGYPYPLTKLRTYAELHAACRQWGEETFPAVQKLAVSLGADDIGRWLEAMKAASDEIDAERNVETNRAVFDTNANALEKRFSQLGTTCETATGQMKRLKIASKEAIAEYERRNFPPSEFVQVGADPAAVLAALEAADNRWKRLVLDVKRLRGLLGKAQAREMGTLYGSIGLTTWKSSAQRARVFMADVPLQQRFLNGDDYYDNCGPPVEGKWYRITLPAKTPALPGLLYPVGHDGKVLFGWLNPAAGIPDPYTWRFQKWAKGWWNIVTGAGGEKLMASKGLDQISILSMPQSFSGIEDRNAFTSSVVWRLLPAGKGCRLINSSFGDTKSLATTPHGVRLMDTKLEDGDQQWKLEFVK